MLGDPIEARALGTVLGRGRPEQSPLLIGAIKSNLGHLEAAAGIAGFIKTVLAVQCASIPRNLHFETPNPHIAFDQMRLKVVAEQQEWPSGGHLRRAGVSSFGFGGTNAHVVLEQAPAVGPVVQQDDPAVTTLLISGKTEERIASMSGRLAEWMTGDGAEVALADVAHTLGHHRDLHRKFATVCARDRDQAVVGLRALAACRTDEYVVGPHEGTCRAGTVFVYSGQGSHWAGMGRQLLADEPVFAAAVAELEPAFVEHVGFSLQQVLADGEPVRGDARVQPVLMGLQLALTQLWRSYGVHPDAVIGHSMGEVSAAVVAGALSAADGFRVIATRSRLMSRLAGQGAVALLKLDAEAAEAVIADYPEVSFARFLVAAPNGDRRGARPRRCGNRRARVRRPVRPTGEHGGRFAHRVDGPDPSRLACSSRRFDVQFSRHTVLFDCARPHRRAVAGRRVLGGQRAPAGPVLRRDRRGRPGPCHFHRGQRSSHADSSHHRNPRVGDPSPQHRDPAARQRRILSFHTALNAAHTIIAPVTPHPPEPHPVLPSTPWHHTRHWTDVGRRGARGDVSRRRDRWCDSGGVVCDLTWPVRPLSGAGTTADASWLVVAGAASAPRSVVCLETILA